MAGKIKYLSEAFADLDIIKDSNERTGFPNYTDSVFLFVDATRTFTITPVGTDFYWYESSKKYTSTGQSIIISDVTGIHVIYELNGALVEVANPAGYIIAGLIRKNVLVSIINWNAVLGEAIYVGEERHGIQMSGATHSLIHFRDGLSWLSGMKFDTFNMSGDGTDSSAQFSIESGSVSDEDIHLMTPFKASIIEIPVFYMLGAEASPVWYRRVTPGFPVSTQDGTSGTLLGYNFNNAGVWEVGVGTSSDYIWYHYFAATDPAQTTLSVMGQNLYANANTARAGMQDEISGLILDTTLSPEMKIIGSVLYKTGSYANDVNSIIVVVDSGENYEDLRFSSITRTMQH